MDVSSLMADWLWLSANLRNTGHYPDNIWAISCELQKVSQV